MLLLLLCEQLANYVVFNTLTIINLIHLFSEGVCEIWLTSEDTGAYGKDIGVSITELLWQLVEVIPEGCRMRIGMTNPPYILEHLEVRPSIRQTLTSSDPRIFRFSNLQTLKP